jgi:hypothetical protein
MILVSIGSITENSDILIPYKVQGRCSFLKISQKKESPAIENFMLKI